MTKRKHFLWSLAIILCTLSWGALHPSSKHVMEQGISPILISFLRFLFGCLPMIPLYIAETVKREKPVLRDYLVLSLLGALGVSGFSLLIYSGLEMSNATSSSILVNSQPLFTFLLSAVILKERLTLNRIVGVVIGLVGISLVATRGDYSALSLRSGYFLGNILCVLGALSISIYYIGLKKYVTRFGSTIPTFITITAGTIILLAVALLTGEDFGSILDLGPVEWLWILFIGVIATGAAYIVFHLALDVLGVIRATGFKFLVPVFGVVLSVLFLGERANTAVYIGIGIVFAAILFIQSRSGADSR